ncbi:MAG: tRNA (N6-threonylcarbamoyladenosine(37)-N6)-methyltransferase TrmO [Proteobacteria bacterium]|nr:tRNA (N6-threonylcarbamoyladenosine(37)-N6)-methyltransferase TrmO [Pseudomonadota bacterium]
MFRIQEIGIVHSQFQEPSDPHKMREYGSTIELHQEFAEGLYGIEESEYLDVLFYFSRSQDYDLIVEKTYYGDKKGVFACRTPNRPSGIGLSRVKLLGRDKNRLSVRGLDAIDQTPVIDIKPYFSDLSEAEEANIKSSEQRKKPRKTLVQLIKNNRLEELLLRAGTLHGHFCPGLASGVMAAVDACNRIKVFSDGMEDLIAIIEINSCFIDGIQFVTGCTLGNNSLIYKDLGKTAVTLTLRNGNGVRYSQKKEFRNLLDERFPQFSELFKQVVIKQNRSEGLLKEFKQTAMETSFELLKFDLDEIYKIEEVDTNLPDYAPIRDSVICTSCNESIMKEREIPVDQQNLCISCANSSYHQLDGRGIVTLP